MATISFDTYPDMMKDYERGIENDNYDNELRIFTVPEAWAAGWIKQFFYEVELDDLGYDYFETVYSWDDTYQMYSDAHAAGVLIEEHIEPRYV